MLILIVVLYIGFIIFDIKYALVIAVLTSLLDFLPLFGIGAVLLPWAILALLLGEYILTVGLIVLYVICLAIREVAEPKMMGKSIGLNTYETFFLLFIGFKIGGLVGLLFSIPLGVLGINLYKAGVLDSIVEDCKYIAISVDKFSREGKNSINKEIDRRMNN
jgi:predicted PurR-regulated permease PerM